MTDESKASRHEAWTRLRFAVVGPLLSAPPPKGELRSEIEALSRKQWRHPATGHPIRFGVSTIERWYYKALAQKTDPVAALRRRVRKDRGQGRCLKVELVQRLVNQYRAHRHWSYKLHADNLAVQVEAKPDLGPLPSYPTLVRFMKAHGLFKTARTRNARRPGAIEAQEHLDHREVRSFEATHVGGLWHLDFHKGSLQVLDPAGRWSTPIALAVLDDFSRLCCHIQWYCSETAEDLVHGLSQAIQKRGLPRALLTDNGSAMIAEETTQGLLRLGITHDTTLPYSPYQNGKQEAFWGPLEGRLVAMLEGVKDLRLDFLNLSTQAWVELEYHRTIHSEIGEKPLDRFLRGPDVLRESPSSEALRLAFRAEVRRTQRRSDGTVCLEGVRFEVPSRFRHLERVTLRAARWNLASVHLIDERTGALLAPIYPIDKAKNADARRRTIEPGPLEALCADAQAPVAVDLAPLLRKLLEQYAATGAPPGYLPQRSAEDPKEVQE